jgi:5-(carboxyamino)imidazole ribonucleotide synthase
VRPGRKIGHVTLLGDDAEELLARAHRAERLIVDGPGSTDGIVGADDPAAGEPAPGAAPTDPSASPTAPGASPTAPTADGESR